MNETAKWKREEKKNQQQLRWKNTHENLNEVTPTRLCYQYHMKDNWIYIFIYVCVDMDTQCNNLMIFNGIERETLWCTTMTQMMKQLKTSLPNRIQLSHFNLISICHLWSSWTALRCVCFFFLSLFLVCIRVLCWNCTWNKQRSSIPQKR